MCIFKLNQPSREKQISISYTLYYVTETLSHVFYPKWDSYWNHHGYQTDKTGF